MAHTNQQRKRIRQSEKESAANRARRSRVATTVKKFEAAAATPEKKAGMMDAFKAAMSELARAARLGVISKGAASRKTSRLAARAKKAATAQ